MRPTYHIANDPVYFRSLKQTQEKWATGLNESQFFLSDNIYIFPVTCFFMNKSDFMKTLHEELNRIKKILDETQFRKGKYN